MQLGGFLISEDLQKIVNCNIIINSMNKKRKARTYARNRTKLSRRGFEKNPERDSVFLLKLILSVFGGFLWIRFSESFRISGIIFSGLPIGAILSVFWVLHFEKRSDNRKIFYAVTILCTILSYFLPVGIVI